MTCTKKKLRRMALKRKLHILRSLTKSKSVKKTSIVMDAMLYIYKLKLQIEAIKQEYQCLINNIQEVKVENIGGGYLTIRVTCKKGEDLLVSIMEAFEEMKLNVVQASVTCNHFFAMEAIVEANDIDAGNLNQAVLTVIKRQTIIGA